MAKTRTASSTSQVKRADPASLNGPKSSGRPGTVHRSLQRFVTLTWIHVVLPAFSALYKVIELFNAWIIAPLHHALARTPIYPHITAFLTKHRGWLVLFLALPASFLFDTFFTIRNWYARRFLSTPHLHEERVREVQAQVRRWNESGRTKPMCTARPSYMSMSIRKSLFKDECSKIRIDLHDVLEVDTQAMTVRVEPLVDMGQISRHLLPLGYQLALSIEMEDLTVGGLLMGVGLETNSHIYGLLFETCEEYEIVLGDGSLVRASRTENPDLYQALPWSHGTLGFLVSATLKIIPAKPYMHLTYTPCYTQDEFITRITEMLHRERPPQFVEATIYSKERSIIMHGNFADTPNTPEERAKINRANSWYKEWFFRHAEHYFDSGEGDEFIPLRDYIHRHTRSIFWELEDMIPFGNEPWYRYLFGWLGAPKISFLKLFTHTPEIRKQTVYQHVGQDMLLPLRHLKEAIRVCDDTFGNYPLLFYPVKVFQRRPNEPSGFMRNPKHPYPGFRPAAEMFFDLGIYGVPREVQQGRAWDAPKAIDRMESFCRDHDGYYLLWADSFSSREDFEKTFDHTLYHKVRAKYHAEGAFPQVYDKVKGQW